MSNINTSDKDSLWKHHGDGEHLGNGHFLLIPHCLKTSIKKKFCPLEYIWFLVFKCFQYGQVCKGNYRPLAYRVYDYVRARILSYLYHGYILPKLVTLP